MPMECPCGTWPSPFTPERVAAQSVRLLEVAIDGGRVHWLERRPQDGGRMVLVRREADGRITDCTAAPFNVRTRVHEYGGGACLVVDETAWFSNFDDQRIYRVELARQALPVAVTPAGGWRYADASLDRARQRLICVREDHTGGGEPIAALVAVPADGPVDAGVGLVSGDDFYAAPRVSADGARLCWLAWRHPAMPWDGTGLWAASIGADGALRDAARVAGGPEESIYAPGWSPDGSLYFASDRTGWWQLYRCRPEGGAWTPPEPVVRNPPAGAEFGRPQWTFGTTTWAFAGETDIVLAYTVHGRWHLAVADVGTGVMRDVPTAFEPGEWLAAVQGAAVIAGGSDLIEEAVVRVDLASGGTEVIRRTSEEEVDPGSVSRAVAVSFASTGGEAVHAFYYAPAHPVCRVPAAERPPLVVIGHGGPTSAARATLDLRIQYWTSRGFAVVDVNYRGSSGYGRAYRQRLHGAWGVIDVADLVAAAQSLCAEGLADPARMVIRGGSAGGYTVLAALAFHPGVFAAGASYYGISDLESLARDTHKFESRYLERLVGPYPEARDVYRARSPIHAADRIACPLILFQGLEDRVVPPDQSEAMAAAVRANGWPVEYLAFEGEQHGFRRAETIARCLEAERTFYAAGFGL